MTRTLFPFQRDTRDTGGAYTYKTKMTLENPAFPGHKGVDAGQSQKGDKPQSSALSDIQAARGGRAGKTLLGDPHIKTSCHALLLASLENLRFAASGRSRHGPRRQPSPPPYEENESPPSVTEHEDFKPEVYLTVQINRQEWETPHHR